MFSTNQQQQSNEPIPASKNVSAWESLISDLESHGEDDDGEGGGGLLNGGASSSLPLSTRSGNGGDEEKMEQESEERLPQLLTNIHRDSSAAAPNASNDRGEQQATTKLESPSQLKDWMAYQSTNTKCAPHSNHMGRKVDAAYTLKAAQIALSLAKYLGRQFEQDNFDEESHREDLPSISFEDIIVDNVIVKNVESGEAVSAVLESTSSTSGGATNHRSGCNTERRQVLALGMIMYELFTEGNPPPTWLQQSLKSSASVLSFSTSLQISELSEEDDDHMALGGDRRKNKDDDDDVMDEADEAQPFVRKQRLRRCDEKGKEESVPTLLKLAGVPRSICRLISDMLSNRGDNDVAGLFQCDKSVSCFAEVIMDLEQMVEQPKDFLYDTVRLNPKPIVRNKLYSRQKELEQGIELARRCVMDASSVKQEVLVISGLSGEQLTELCLFCRIFTFF